MRVRIGGLGYVVLALCLASGGGCSAGEPDGATDAVQGADTSAVVEAAPADAAPVEVMQDGRNVAQRLQDATVVARVKMRLVDETALRPHTFEAEAQGGQVTLRGKVKTAQQRTLAAEVAQRVEGVRTVVNQVQATEAPSQPPTITGTPPAAVQPTPASPTPQQQPPVSAQRPQPQQPAPGAAQTPARETAPAQAAEAFYTVQSGDNLWVIARKNNITIDRLRQLNDLRSNNLQPGQKLRVK